MKSVYGYELAGGRLTTKILRERIKFLEKGIKDGKWKKAKCKAAANLAATMRDQIRGMLAAKGKKVKTSSRRKVS